VNPDIKAKWLEDLRSGNFRQGRAVLHRVTRDDNGKIVHEFCCLGVLCEQAVAAGVVERTFVGDASGTGHYRYHAPGVDGACYGDANYLPRVVAEWAGLDTHSPGVVDPHSFGGSVSLADLNDSWRHDFNTLATMIENSPSVGLHPDTPEDDTDDWIMA
jgi:hypothetical protein